MSKTVTGRHLYALGGNEHAARLSGIQTNRMKWLAYCISAFLSSVVGVLSVSQLSVADPQTQARGYELNAIAASVVGGCSLQGGVGTIPGTLLGALFLRVVIDGVAKIIKTGADVYEGLIVGVLVVFAVTFTKTSANLSLASRKLFSGPLGWVTILNLTLLSAVMMALLGAKLLRGPSSDGCGLAGLHRRRCDLLFVDDSSLERKTPDEAGRRPRLGDRGDRGRDRPRQNLSRSSTKCGRGHRTTTGRHGHSGRRRSDQHGPDR